MPRLHGTPILGTDGDNEEVEEAMYAYIKTNDNAIHIVDDITQPSPPDEAPKPMPVDKKKMPCVWTRTETRDGIIVFHTSCGETYSFYPWILNETQYNYCPECGKKRSKA